MTTVVIVIHLMVVIAMIGLILLQRSEGGALGIGGGQNAFLTGRGAGNVLSHTTAYLAIAFFLTSLGLAFIAKYQSRPSDILERLPASTAPATTESPTAPPIDGTPTSAEDLLEQLGGSSGGPQTPPTADGATTPPAAEGAAAPPAAEGAAIPAPTGEAPATTEGGTEAPATPSSPSPVGGQ